MTEVFTDTTALETPRLYSCEGAGCVALHGVLQDATRGESELLKGHNIPARMQVVSEIQDYVQERISERCRYIDLCLAAQGDATEETRDLIGTGLGGDL